MYSFVCSERLKAKAGGAPQVTPPPMLHRAAFADHEKSSKAVSETTGESYSSEYSFLCRQERAILSALAETKGSCGQSRGMGHLPCAVFYLSCVGFYLSCVRNCPGEVYLEVGMRGSQSCIRSWNSTLRVRLTCISVPSCMSTRLEVRT